MKSVEEYIQEASDLLEKSKKAKRPTKFVPTHFHMSNLKGLLGKKHSHTKLMYHDGAFWHMQTDNETGRRKIAKWNGNPNNRAGWNAASVDGEIVNGKLKEYPKGVTFADMQAQKDTDSKDTDSKDTGSKDTGTDGKKLQGAKKKDAPNQYLRNADKATADKEATKRIKRLIELLDALEEEIAVLKNSGMLHERELTSAEQNELMGIVADLKILMKNPNLSNVNRRMIDAQVPRAKKAVSQVRQARASDQGDKKPVKVTPTDGDPGDFANGDEIPAKYLDADGNPDWSKIPSEITYGTIGGVGVERPPEGDLPAIKDGDEIPDAYLDADGNPDWSKIPKGVTYGTIGGVGVERPPEGGDTGSKKASSKKAAKVVSGSLAKFAKSDKGGLANDPEEAEAIKELQQYLNDLGFDTGDVDGKYGRATINGVKAFQKYFGAAVDGDAGPETIGQIIKLRSFIFKDGTDFVQFRKDMDRLETLVGKIGAKESTDMSSMSSILETLRRLDEALSDAEKEELKSILDKYDSLLNDGEFAAAMPKVSLDRYMAAVEKAKEATKDVATGKPSDKLDGKDGDLSTGKLGGKDGDLSTGKPSDKLDGKDGDLKTGDKPVAAYKVVTGSGQGKRYKIFDKDGNEIRNGRGSGPTNIPTKDEYDKSPAAQTNAPTGTTGDMSSGSADMGMPDETDPVGTAGGGQLSSPDKDADPNVDQTQVDRDSMFKTGTDDQEETGKVYVMPSPKGAGFVVVRPDGTVDDQLGRKSSADKAKEVAAGKYGLNADDIEVKDPKQGTPSSKLDGKDGDLSTGKAPVFKTQDEAAKVVKQFAEFADEIMPQLSAEEQKLFKEIIGAANEKPTAAPMPRNTGITADF